MGDVKSCAIIPSIYFTLLFSLYLAPSLFLPFGTWTIFHPWHFDLTFIKSGLDFYFFLYQPRTSALSHEILKEFVVNYQWSFFINRNFEVKSIDFNGIPASIIAKLHPYKKKKQTNSNSIEYIGNLKNSKYILRVWNVTIGNKETIEVFCQRKSAVITSLPVQGESGAAETLVHVTGKWFQSEGAGVWWWVAGSLRCCLCFVKSRLKIAPLTCCFDGRLLLLRALVFSRWLDLEWI